MAAFWQSLPDLQFKSGQIGVGNINVEWGKPFTPGGGVEIAAPGYEMKQKKPLIPVDFSDPIVLVVIASAVYFFVLRK